MNRILDGELDDTSLEMHLRELLRRIGGPEQSGCIEGGEAGRTEKSHLRQSSVPSKVASGKRLSNLRPNTTPRFAGVILLM